MVPADFPTLLLCARKDLGKTTKNRACSFCGSSSPGHDWPGEDNCGRGGNTSATLDLQVMAIPLEVSNVRGRCIFPGLDPQTCSTLSRSAEASCARRWCT